MGAFTIQGLEENYDDFVWLSFSFHLSPGSAGSATPVYQSFDWSDQLRPNAFQRELNIINGTKWFSWNFYFIKSTVKLILELGFSANKTRFILIFKYNVCKVRGFRAFRKCWILSFKSELTRIITTISHPRRLNKSTGIRACTGGIL